MTGEPEERFIARTTFNGRDLYGVWRNHDSRLIKKEAYK